MSDSAPPRSNRKLRWASGLVLGALVTFFTWLIAVRSADPRGYIENKDGIVAGWTQPGSAVAISCALVLVEATFAWLLFNFSRSPALWRRALLCVACTVPAGLFGMTSVMHAPPYYVIHVLWLVSLAALAIVTLLVTGTVALITWMRGSAMTSHRP